MNIFIKLRNYLIDPPIITVSQTISTLLDKKLIFTFKPSISKDIDLIYIKLENLHNKSATMIISKKDLEHDYILIEKINELEKLLQSESK